MKNIVFLSILISFSFPALSQGDVTIEEYLGTARKDQSLELFQAQLSFLESNKYNSPWLNRVEFRIGSEDANVSMNEYRLRLSPSNPYEIKANKLYYNKHVKSIGTQYKVALNLALKNRYQMLIDYSFLLRSIALNEQNLVMVNEIMRNIGLLGIENIDLSLIIGVQSDQTELMLKSEELKSQLAETEYYILLDLPNKSLEGFSSSELTSVDRIKLYLDSKEAEVEWTSLYVLDAEEDFQLKEQMLKIDKAESRSNIGYIQGNFDTERGNEVNEHIGFQIGVRLPIVNPDKPNLNRKRVELIEDQKDLDATKNFVVQKKDLTVIQLNHLIGQYQLLQNRTELSKTISIQGGGNVDLNDVAKMKKYQFSLERERIILERDIRELYIEYLDIKGLLVRDPLINYLSEDFRSIE
ncbi:MAG: hypothetical protein JXR07_13635 [Reichenbachiella sp.]